MDKAEARKLIDELNDLSSNFEKNKERMVEIAKILLTDHYWYLPRKNKQWSNVRDAEKKSAEDDQKSTV
jgi:hypothetical protein